MKYYIELPGDGNGNTSMPPAIIEGFIVQGGTAGTAHCSNPDRQALVIKAPSEVARYIAVYTDTYGGFAEVEGPARTLTMEEHRAIIKKLLHR